LTKKVHKTINATEPSAMTIDEWTENPSLSDVIL